MADNPGTWMFHCHLDFHSETGMSFLIKTGHQTDLPREPYGWPQCGDFVYRTTEINRSSAIIHMQIHFLIYNYIIYRALISVCTF